MNTGISNKIKITSVGTYLPSEIVESSDLLDEIGSQVKYGWPNDLLSRLIGVKQRRVSEPNSSPSDLAIPAARQAIEKCSGVSNTDIDMVIFCGIERDQPEPATAHIINHKLGLNAKYAFDTSNACYGFMQGMETAANYIKAGSVKCALIVTGEVPSKVMWGVLEALKKGMHVEKARNLLGALTVGDAGGAIILQKSDSGDTSGFEIFNTTSASAHINKCIYKRNDRGVPEGQMLMSEINKVVYNSHHHLIDETLELVGWTNFDWVLVNQTGLRPFYQMANLKGVSSSRMVKSFDTLGNITSATFPVNFKKLCDNVKVAAGDRIGGLFAGSGVAIGQIGYTY